MQAELDRMFKEKNGHVGIAYFPLFYPKRSYLEVKEAKPYQGFCKKGIVAVVPTPLTV